MAFINNMYVFVETEDVSRGVEVSAHPVEDGLDITDNIKRLPITVSIAGEIVGENAASVLSNIASLHQKGKFIKYVGRNIINNAVIESFDTGHPNTIYGGCSFSMTIREIRIAKPAYVSSNTATKKETKSGTQQVQSNTVNKKHTVKRGDTLWGIAKSYYGSGSQFTKIYQANRDKISNPNLIYVGQVLLIP